MDSARRNVQENMQDNVRELSFFGAGLYAGMAVSNFLLTLVLFCTASWLSGMIALWVATMLYMFGNAVLRKARSTKP